MYGKAFESMYSGSMVGAGLNVFAVWNYIIATNRMGYVEVNPKMLAFVLGGAEAEIVSALEYLCRPDEGSRSKAEDGRRLLREGEYQYRVVNWEFYERIKNENDRRAYNCQKQREYRARKKQGEMTTKELAEKVGNGEYGKKGRKAPAQVKIEEVGEPPLD